MDNVSEVRSSNGRHDKIKRTALQDIDIKTHIHRTGHDNDGCRSTSSACETYDVLPHTICETRIGENDLWRARLVENGLRLHAAFRMPGLNALLLKSHFQPVLGLVVRMNYQHRDLGPHASSSSSATTAVPAFGPPLNPLS
jgi:hypothetical protein